MIKTAVILIVLIITTNCFSQFDDNFATEQESFQAISKPSPNSHLSQYILKNIGVKYLRSIRFSDKQKSNGKTIRLSFNVQKDNKPSNLRINTGNIELNKKITKTFKNFSLEKLELDNSSQTGICSVQLFSKKDNRTIINASSVAVCDTPPIFKNCSSVEDYYKSTSCFYDGLKEYIIDNFSLSIFSPKKLKRMNSLKLFTRFSIDTKGKIYNVHEEDIKFKNYMNNPTGFNNPKDIEQELYRIIKLLDKVDKPAMRNGKPIYYNYDTFYSLALQK